ncbi:hypothetical protein CASFOL_025019 [Castilleja foliolosa]|uniref:Kinesin motor domain-containing protein n=1 Tax=Castilleja foliolosa TaxID=1961234 RepID=A0ABD3CTM9_9LAMI
MSNAVLGYHQAVKENRNLYNMVQDLKGNIRVYCRIRPTINSEVQNVIDFIGKDGSLVVMDPKPLKDGKKVFQFNQVFCPTATQEIQSCVSDNSLALPDATLRPVKSADDVINLMKLGEVNRAVNSTAMNSTSSRSHSVLSVHVHGKDASGSVIHSCLHLVDLAGSERVDKS